MVVNGDESHGGIRKKSPTKQIPEKDSRLTILAKEIMMDSSSLLHKAYQASQKFNMEPIGKAKKTSSKAPFLGSKP